MLKPPSFDELIESIQRFGTNSNSFMTLYPGFHYFKSSNPKISGFIAYRDMPWAWVGGAEPLTEPHVLPELLTEFSLAASQAGKSVVFLPVSREVAETACQIGFSSIFIGSEPTFDLNQFPATGKTWVNVVSTAKHLDSKGAQVHEFNPSLCSALLKKELNSITQEWLDSRKMAPLAFLNQVEPWALSQFKRYFYLKINEKIFSFLAAVPIWARQGWYLVDLLRRNNSPPGASELLILKTLKKLKSSGALHASLGVSPLAEMNHAHSIPLAHAEKHLKLYSFFNLLYEKGGGLYGFQSLYQFKLKLSPSFSTPTFLIFKSHSKPAELNLQTVISVFQAFTQRGILWAIVSSIKRWIQNTPFMEWIQTNTNDFIVLRSMPHSLKNLAYRCKFTLVLFFLNLGCFFFSIDRFGKIDLQIEKQWGYSWNSFIQSPFHSLVLSPFLHSNIFHLGTNLLLLILCTGGLECFTGTRITIILYGISMILSNPLTSIFFQPFHIISPTEIDVGASLGIFGCAGALSLLFKTGTYMKALLLILTFLFTWRSHQWLELNHWIALGLGLVVGSILLPFVYESPKHR